jgi:hypothetical protein
VKAHAAIIYDRLRGIGGAVMPPPPTKGEGLWPQARIELFAQWMQMDPTPRLLQPGIPCLGTQIYVLK